jgi:hypothetical protein
MDKKLLEHTTTHEYQAALEGSRRKWQEYVERIKQCVEWRDAPIMIPLERCPLCEESTTILGRMTREEASCLKRRCNCVLDRTCQQHEYYYGCHPYFGRAKDAESAKEQLKWAKKLLKTIESYIV